MAGLRQEVPEHQDRTGAERDLWSSVVLQVLLDLEREPPGHALDAAIAWAQRPDRLALTFAGLDPESVAPRLRELADQADERARNPPSAPSASLPAATREIRRPTPRRDTLTEVLRLLAGVREPAEQRWVAAQLAMSASFTSSVCSRLETRGLVKATMMRGASAGSKVKLVSITPRGLTEIAQGEVKRDDRAA